MNKKFKWDLILVLVTLFWGLGYVLSSLTLREMSPYFFTFLRYGISSIILLPIIFFVNRFKNFNLETLFAGAAIGISLGIGAVIQNVGLLYTTPSKSGFLTGFSVVLVPIFIAVIYKKVPDKRTVFGIILSMIGVTVLSLDFNNLDLALNKGDILTLIATVFFAINLLIIHKFVDGKDVLLVSAIEFFFISLTGFLPWLITERTIGSYGSVTLISLLFTIIFCTVIAFALQNYALPNTTPINASIIFLLEPVFCAIFSVFIGDKLKLTVLLGGFIILVGTFLTNVKSNKGKEEETERVEEKL